MGTTMMKTVLHAPTDYYCQEVELVDERLCALIAERQQISRDNPGFPGAERIEDWRQRYGIDVVRTWHIFSILCREQSVLLIFPVPTGFLRFLPIAKSVEVDGVVYAVTHMKQYENVSIVYVEISLETLEENVQIKYGQVHLSITPTYTCEQHSGSGHGKYIQASFVVTPPLPDNVSQLAFSLNVAPMPAPCWRTVEIGTASVTVK